MTESLNDVLQDMSQFIQVEVGESFTGTYRGFKRVPNKFDSDKESIELTFEINGSDKTTTGMGLARALVEAKVAEGDTVECTKVSKKGNVITWAVKKVAAPVEPPKAE